MGGVDIDNILLTILTTLPIYLLLGATESTSGRSRGEYRKIGSIENIEFFEISSPQ